LYCAVPAVARLGWVRPDVDLLLQCIEQVMAGIRLFPIRVAVKWEMLRERILAPTYEPNPRFWVRDLVTGEWVNKPADLIERDPENWQARPVPFLSGVEPLEPYVIRPKPKTEIPRPSQRRRAASLWLGLKPLLGPLADRSAADEEVPTSSGESA
jgi:hypothetical protein